jgi:hypothetical protein
LFCLLNLQLIQGGAILPSFWIQADPRLVLDQGQNNKNAPYINGDFEVHSVGQGIYRVDRSSPGAEKMTFQLSFRMPLINPVGKYELPYAWIRGVQRDTRESILSDSPSISFDVQFPQAVAPPQVNDVGDGSLQWFVELVQSGNESFPERSSNNFPEDGLDATRVPFILQRQVAYVEVNREQSPLRGTQQIEIVEGVDKNHLVFEATIDSSETAWLKDYIRIPKGYRLESCQVFEKENSRTGLQNQQSLDVSLYREEQNVYGLLLQQPRSGIFLLRVQASSNERLPKKGGFTSGAVGFHFRISLLSDLARYCSASQHHGPC